MFNRVFSIRSLLAAKTAVTNASLITRTLKSDLKIKWIRPEKVSSLHPSKSGDRSTEAIYEKTEVALEFEKSDELKKVDEIVRKQFTLEFRPTKATTEFAECKEMQKVQRHSLDTKSEEAAIARMTQKIRHLQNVLNNLPHRNGPLIKFVKELIEKRHKKLNKLRKVDYRRFEWLLEKLDIEFKPQPESFIMIARKEGLRQLTRIHCDDIRNTRLEAYRKELSAQQLPFLEEKIKNLEFLRNEQIELGVEATVTKKDIDTARQQYEELKAERAKEQPEDDDGDSTKKWKIY